MRTRRRRLAVLSLAAALVGLGALAPLGAASADEPEAPAAAAAGSQSLLWDPGPSNRCFSVIEEGTPDGVTPNPFYDTSGCADVDAAALAEGGSRADPNDNCWPKTAERWIGPAFGKTCPAWQFNTHGWIAADYDKKTPGFDLQVAGEDDLSLTLVNNARDLPADEVCGLKEATVTYEYKPGALKRMPALEENLEFTYNATITGPSTPEDYGCELEKRAILTSDILWTTPNPDYVPGWTEGDDPRTRWDHRVHLISVVHYNPSDWATGAAVPEDGVLWWNKCVNGECRVTVADPIQMADGETTPIAVDFTGLAKKYATYLGLPAGTLADDTSVRSVQVVTSNKGIDTTAVVDSIDFRARGASPAVDRVAGPDRYETAVAVSQEAFPESAPTVFVASGASFPDALASGPAARKLGGPVLLTDPGVLPGSVSAEIERLGATKVVVVGGEAAVSDDVFSALAELVPDTERVAGSDRFETSREVAEYAFDAGADRAVLATGADFPDALSAGAANGDAGPVVLVNGTDQGLDAATSGVLSGLGLDEIWLAGGEQAVSAGIESAAGAIAATTRLAGSDRYETAQAINARAFDTAGRVLLATGEDFPDALAGSAWAPALGAPLFTVQGGCVPPDVLSAVFALGATSVTLLGGQDTLATGVEQLVPC